MELLNPMSKADFPAYTATAGASAGNTTAWNAGPQGVLVWCTTDAYIRVGNGVTATSADTPLPAGTPVPIYVPQSGGDATGGSWRVSAIQISAGGTLYAKPINIR